MFRRFVTAVLLACLAALAAPASAASAAPSAAPVKFYVVRDSFGGQPEFLFEIAQRFLGNGDRNPEIFQLNKGRLQPDGLRLTRPEAILPGWILQLPPDAKGEGVQTGALPTVAPAPSAAPALRLAPAPEEGRDWWKWGILAAGAVLLLASAAATWWLWRRGDLRKPPPARTPAQEWAAGDTDTDRYYYLEDSAPPVAAPDRRPVLLLAAVAVVAVATLVAGVVFVLTSEEPSRPAAALQLGRVVGDSSLHL
jgi:hypothetical protein